jgi:hypothetical protein
MEFPFPSPLNTSSSLGVAGEVRLNTRLAAHRAVVAALVAIAVLCLVKIAAVGHLLSLRYRY